MPVAQAFGGELVGAAARVDVGVLVAIGVLPRDKVVATLLRDSVAARFSRPKGSNGLRSLMARSSAGPAAGRAAASQTAASARIEGRMVLKCIIVLVSLFGCVDVH